MATRMQWPSVIKLVADYLLIFLPGVAAQRPCRLVGIAKPLVNALLQASQRFCHGGTIRCERCSLLAHVSRKLLLMPPLPFCLQASQASVLLITVCAGRVPRNMGHWYTRRSNFFSRRSSYDLAPFPFRSDHHSFPSHIRFLLHFEPLAVRSCVSQNSTAAVLRANSERPWMHLQRDWRCASQVPDTALIKDCRAKSGTLSLHARDLFRRCPSNRSKLQISSFGFRDNSETLEKYKVWNDGNWCEPGSVHTWNVGGGSQSLHKCVMKTMMLSSLSYLKPGDHVLDWGSGCGHKLSWASQLFGVHGFGVELSPESVAWASKHSAGRYCAVDGRDMSWIPDSSFDAVMSFGALYHLHGEEQCIVVGQLVEKLRPGRLAWLAFMAPENFGLQTEGWVMNSQEWRLLCAGSEKGHATSFCKESRRYMIPPLPTWEECFAHLRQPKGPWVRQGVDATFQVQMDLLLFVDRQDASAVYQYTSEALPGYSLLI